MLPITPRRLVVTAALTLTLVGLTACGTETLNTSQVEETIATQFKAQQIELTEVNCEDDIEATVGAAVTCTGINPSGAKLFIEGKVNKRTEDGASFAVKAVRGEAPGPVVAKQALAILEEKVGEPAKGMTCPKIIDIPSKTPAECVLTTMDGTRYPVSVSFDKDNQLSAEVGKTPLGK